MILKMPGVLNITTRGYYDKHKILSKYVQGKILKISHLADLGSASFLRNVGEFRVVLVSFTLPGPAGSPTRNEKR